MRRLATVETVASLRPIDGADNIEVARVRGWDVVVKIGDFQPGDRCVYFEIDSMLDVSDPRFEFLAGRGVRTDSEGRSGHVLRTMRLRGQYSQGLALPLAAFPELPSDPLDGFDATAQLGVVKWEPPIPAGLTGVSDGPFPSWTWKTDAERVQNLGRWFPMSPDDQWVASEKIDGMSVTYTLDVETGGLVVCSRNWRIAHNPNNAMWQMADKYDIRAVLAALTQHGFNPVIQGELYGEGIQANPLKVKGQHLGVFNVSFGFQRLGWGALQDITAGLPWVPAVNYPLPATVEEAVAQVDGMKSRVAPDRQAEGVVWSAPGRDPWKAINNRYLMKHAD